MEVIGAAGRRVAVLSKKSLATHPYHCWFAGDEVLLYAEDTAATRAELQRVGRGYARVELFDNWKGNRAIDVAVLREHESRPVDRIVALSECDQVRAGQLRARLGIPGQDAASARAFRDKTLMKRYAVRAGLDVPAFAAVERVWDLVDFATSLSGPVVLKPVDGSGSRDVAVIADADAVRAWADSRTGLEDEPAHLIAEEYIDAPMLSVDGIMCAGRILAAVVSAYTVTCLGSLSGLRPHGLLQLDDESATAARTRRYARAVVAALPGPAEPTSFHLEVFDHPQRGLLLCEIAGRTGGGRINDAVRSTLGVDLEETCARGQAGQHVQVPAVVLPGRAGDVLIPSPGAQLRRAMSSCDVAGVVDFRLHLREGQLAARAAKVGDTVADLLLHGADHADLVRTYAAVLQWLGRALEWAPRADTST